MADSWETELPPRLVGYESWLFQMPCIDSSGDVFVSVPLPKEADSADEPPHRWLVVIGDVIARREFESQRTRLESPIVGWTDLLDGHERQRYGVFLEMTSSRG